MSDEISSETKTEEKPKRKRSAKTAKTASTSQKTARTRASTAKPAQTHKKAAAAKNEMQKSNIAVIFCVIAVLFALFAVLVVFMRHALKKSTALGTYTVTAETKEDVIEIAGNISAAKTQKLQALDDGRVTGVFVQESERVKKGQIILQLDDTAQRYNLANLDYSIEQKRVSGSQKELALLYVQRKSLVQKLKDRQIVATFDGVIVDLDVSEGDYIEAQDSIGSLVDLSYLKAEVEIAETDVAKLKAGQTVLFHFPAYSGDVEGYVVGYPAIGEITSRGATVVNAVARIDDYPREILPNYSFTGKIQISEPLDLLLVNRLAVGYEGGRAYVEKIISKAGGTKKIFVTVEPYGTEYVQIISGLSVGDSVKQLNAGAISGRFRNNRKKSNTKNDKSGKMGEPGGAGAPPPMM